MIKVEVSLQRNVYDILESRENVHNLKLNIKRQTEMCPLEDLVGRGVDTDDVALLDLLHSLRGLHCRRIAAESAIHNYHTRTFN